MVILILYRDLEKLKPCNPANSTFNKLFVFVAINLLKLSKGQNDASFCSTSQLRRLGKEPYVPQKTLLQFLLTVIEIEIL